MSASELTATAKSANDLRILPSWLGRSPIVWGGLVTAGFYAMLHGGFLRGVVGGAAYDFLLRYCAGHPVVYAEITLFFLGIAALVIRRLDLAEQSSHLKDDVLPERTEEGNTLDDCPELLEHASQRSLRKKDSYHHQRIERAVRHIWLKQTAEPLDEELKYLSEIDEGRANQALSLSRFVTWAVPILGFLGTVIGITMAVANIDPNAMAASDPRAIDGVTRALSVAFDTTALALSLSLVLMFLQYRTQAADFRLLAKVDDAVSAELTGRFVDVLAGSDPNVKAMRRMADGVMESTQHLVEQQVNLWRDSIETAQHHWESSAMESQQQIQAALTHSIREGLDAHGHAVGQVGMEIANRFTEQAEQMRELFGETASQLAQQQQALRDHAQSMLKLAEGTDHVGELQTALNRNLDALAGSHNFESAVESLSAVIHLLNARLSQTSVTRPDSTSPRAA